MTKDYFHAAGGLSESASLVNQWVTFTVTPSSMEVVPLHRTEVASHA